jgi:hypothetical protein
MTDQGVTTGKPLIESDRVEGTTVYDPQGNKIGSIKRLMIEKISGRVAYAVMSFGGFLGMGEEEHLAYDTSLGGYRTDITRRSAAPCTCVHARPILGSRELHDYYGTRYYRVESDFLLDARFRSE